MDATPVSRKSFSSAPFTVTVDTTFPNGSTASTWPRVIFHGGGVKLGQKPTPPPAGGHVRASRSPPEFVTAKSVPYVVRMASVTALPTFDSQSLPSERPHESERRTSTVDSPITVPRIGWSSAFSSSIRAWISGSAVTPMFHGLWKSAVL
jgi:hypothetical protein